jgi:hypothetical protein
MKVIYVEYLPEQIEKELNNDKNVYHNEEDGSLYLVTDNKFNELQSKYHLTDLKDDDENCVYVWDQISKWIYDEFEQEEYHFMGESYPYSDGAEIVEKTIEGMTDNTQNEITFIESDNWYDEIKAYLLSSLSDVIKESLENNLIAAKEDGLDLAVIKQAFNI